jgi:hypothetical protein
LYKHEEEEEEEEVPLCCSMPVKLSLSSCLEHKGSKTITHMHRDTEREREEREGLNPEPNTLHGNVMAFTCSLFITEDE